MAEFNINISEIKNYAEQLSAGDRVLLSGTVYTSRDAAHKRIFELLDKGEMLPFDLNGACIYFAGPTPTPAGMVSVECHGFDSSCFLCLRVCFFRIRPMVR